MYTTDLSEDIKQRYKVSPLFLSFSSRCPFFLFHHVSPTYIFSLLYQAAGVLPYSFDAKGVMHLLLGCEDRTAKLKYPDWGQDMSCVWLHFGGKKEVDEMDPASTALRELDEETGGVFHKQMGWMASCIKSNSISKLWYHLNLSLLLLHLFFLLFLILFLRSVYNRFPGGKYVLYFLEIPYDTTISQRFALVDPSTRESMDQTRLEWVRFSFFLFSSPLLSSLLFFSLPLFER